MALPAYFETHRTDPAWAVYWLVDIAFSVHQRLTTFDKPIVYGGNTFTPTVLTVEGVLSDSADAAATGGSLTIGNGDDYWATLLAALTEDIRHPQVTVYEAWLDTATLSPTPASVRTVGVFTLASHEWNPLEAKLVLAPVADPNLGRLPFREYGGGSCTYRLFKGAQCGYAGVATTCGGGAAPQRTYEACVALSNQTRFGGFRELPGETTKIVFRWVNGETLREETLTLSRREE